MFEEARKGPALSQQPSSPLLVLFLVSMAALFIEIVLIRWISTEVRVFAFVQNLALIACFLGFGIGCHQSERRGSLLPSLLAMAFLIVLVYIREPHWAFLRHEMSNLLTLNPDAALWGSTSPHATERVALVTAEAIAVMTILLFLLVRAMVPLGQWVGFYLDACTETISAYSANLTGSIAGIWLLPLLAAFWLPPICWFLAAFALLLLLDRSRRTWIAGAGMLALIAVLLLQVTAPNTFWSPYQKLEVFHLDGAQYRISVNNVGYMTISDLTPGYLAANPDFAARYPDSSYDVPFRFVAQRDRVLIVGAGAGNDIAAALRNGAGHVDAVEIDPLIYSLGRRLHPEHPYDSPKVTRIINDARNYLRESRASYDVIVFGLLDSHTEFSGYSNMRVDNYVYTEQAFQQARRLLNPGGVLVLKFEVRAPWTWMGQRFYSMFDTMFGRAPITLYCPIVGTLSSATIYLASNDPALWERAAARPELAGFVAQHPPSFSLSSAGAPPPTTDDWPYVYHRSRSIPRTYLTVAVILLCMAGVPVWHVFGAGARGTWNFFLLGAGFLLLETHMVSRLALYFGTTWLVNCFALTAILVVLVLANGVVSRWHPRDLRLHYALLIAALLFDYFVPWHLLPFSAHLSGIIVSLSYAVPLFFAGIIFTSTFEQAETKSAAFGANIVGAVAGGLAQNLSFITGMNALLLVAAALYAGAAITAMAGSRRRAVGVREAAVAGRVG
jgi:spermidine synthase